MTDPRSNGSSLPHLSTAPGAPVPAGHPAHPAHGHAEGAHGHAEGAHGHAEGHGHGEGGHGEGGHGHAEGHRHGEGHGQSAAAVSIAGADHARAPHAGPAPSAPSRFAGPLLVGGGLLSLAPFTSPAIALLAGVAIALVAGNPWIARTRVWTHKLLPLAVIGLGAAMDLRAVARAGLHGIGYTAVSLTLVLGFGLLLGRLLKVDRQAGLLIAVGTAICGGSAIAAVAPVIRAREHQVSIALATVFLLNAAALLIFPPIGHAAGLGQAPFGLWAALAIHDTSSVVGAGQAYGAQALEVATTVKLARALWIVPVTLGLGYLVSRRGDHAADAPPVKKPWFIAGFLAMAAVVTYVPGLHGAGHLVAFLATRALVLTLFLIGAGLSRAAVRSVGVRPFLQGLLLWIAVAAASLAAVHAGIIAVE